MKQDALLTIDALINLILGLLLLFFPASLVQFLGIPPAPRFYPSILGAVLFGIGLALFIERGFKGRRGSGLGLDGAVAINICGGLALATWLILGDLALPPRGALFLWILVLLLLGISAAELIAKRRAIPAN
jgi:hypothetical protein